MQDIGFDRQNPVIFPNDADGDVLRSMESNGIRLDIKHVVDFNVDLEDWPPNPLLISKLTDEYKDVEVIEPDEEFDGYIQFHLTELVTHDFVIQIQDEASRIAERFGGKCESWGVWSGT